MALATEGYVCAPSPEGVSLESDVQYYSHSRSTVRTPMPTIPQGVSGAAGGGAGGSSTALTFDNQNPNNNPQHHHMQHHFD
eukprot:1934573-Rhodomonas_salina.1